MDTKNALEEVSRELKLMAHYLTLIGLRDGQAGEDARVVARQITALQEGVADRLQASAPQPELEMAQ